MQAPVRGLSGYLRGFQHPGGIIICEERKFIYMKAPRTGGTSILRHVLEPSLGGIIHQKDHPERYTEWMSRLTDEILQDYFIFSFVRNPWDRLVSIAFYFGITLGELVEEFERFQTQASIRSHSLPLCLYTHFDGSPFVEFIGRFENLQDDFDRICDRIGIPKVGLPHASRTRHAHYSTYFDPVTEAAAAACYAEDIETFGYRFERK